MSGGLGRDSLGRQIRNSHDEYGLRILQAAEHGSDLGGGSRLRAAVIFNTMLSQNLLLRDFLQISTASGAAGRAYSALDGFMEFRRRGACPASFRVEA